MQDVKGSFGQRLNDKLDYLIDKNNGSKELKLINMIIKSEQNISVNLTAEEISNFKYAPITSCKVERSFSMYK